MEHTGYSIRVRKDGLEIEVSGDKSFVLAESQRLFDLLFVSGGTAMGSASPDGALRESLMDFLANIAASGHPETILALAYFLGERGHSPLGVGDVEACYDLLGIPGSSNFNADFNSLVRRKLLLEAPRSLNGRKAWLLTEQGLAFIHEKIRPA